MNRITRQKNENYTCISNVFLRDEKLSLKAKGLLAMIMSLPNDWDFSIKGLTSILPEGRSAIYSAIDELKNKGYCKVVLCRENNRIAGNDYVFFEEAQQSILCEKQDSENLNTEVVDVEEQAQINKDINKVKKEKSKDFSFNEKEKNDIPLAADSDVEYNTLYPYPYVAENLRSCWDEWVAYLKRKNYFEAELVPKHYKYLLEYSNGIEQNAQRIIDHAMLGNYRMFAPLRNAEVVEEEQPAITNGQNWE